MQRKAACLRALATDAAGQLDVLGHDGHAFGVDGTQVGVLEQANKVGLGRLLQGKNGRALESQVSLEVLRNLADETLEGQLADEQVSALLVAADLAKRNSTGTVAVGLLDTSGGGGGLACCLGGKLLTGRFASGGLTGGLLGTGHCRLRELGDSNVATRPPREKNTDEFVFHPPGSFFFGNTFEVTVSLISQ